MEINWGLGRDTNLSSNIKSYITYVSSLPSGREEGEYLALDLGGTNFRSAECLSFTGPSLGAFMPDHSAPTPNFHFRVILIRLDSESTSVRMTASKHPVREGSEYSSLQSYKS